MDLKNGYKVVYDVAKNGERNFYASKTGLFEDAEPILEAIKIGDYKLIYEKNGMFYGSITGIPAEDDRCFTEFNKIFVEAKESTEPDVQVVEDTTEPEDEPENTPEEPEDEVNSEEE
jgi:hypothetical protein